MTARMKRKEPVNAASARYRLAWTRSMRIAPALRWRRVARYTTVADAHWLLGRFS
jgi:hypothetical protein